MKPSIYSNPCFQRRSSNPKWTLLFRANSFVAGGAVLHSPWLFSDSENNKSNSATVYYFCSSVKASSTSTPRHSHSKWCCRHFFGCQRSPFCSNNL